MQSRAAIQAGQQVLKTLQDAGFEAYFVGGCVRDLLLQAGSGSTGMTSDREGVTKAVTAAGDIDIATDATPEEVKRVFWDVPVIETGLKHGTVTVLIPATEDVLPIEITTYRTEAGYSDSRHPDSVTFTPSLTEDLKRRDFTINAMAMDAHENIIDPFGGRADLESGIIRAVGSADRRIGEDALRILRALRFAATLGFEVEKETSEALFRNAHMLRQLSAERIFSEFKKLVTGVNAAEVVRRYVDVLGEILPELAAMKGFEQHNEYHRYDVLEHCVRAMEAVNTTPQNCVYMKMAALLHDVGKPLTYSSDDTGRGHFYGHAAKGADMVRAVMKRLKADRDTSGRVVLLVKYHDLVFREDEKLLKRWMRRFTPQVLLELLDIKRADNFATGNMSDELRDRFDAIEDMIRAILEESECFSLKDLAIGGRDIIALGVPEGPEVGRILEDLLEAVIEGKTPNERDPLLTLVKAAIQ